MKGGRCAIFGCAHEPLTVLWTVDGKFGDSFCAVHAPIYEARGYLKEKPA